MKFILFRSFAELEVDRDNAATPTLEMNESLLEDDFEDLSFRFSDMENEGNFQSEGLFLLETEKCQIFSCFCRVTQRDIV